VTGRKASRRENRAFFQFGRLTKQYTAMLRRWGLEWERIVVSHHEKVFSDH